MASVDVIIALLIPFLGTVLGASFVFFMKDEMPSTVQKTLLGFASGVMVAASMWSLLIPSMEMSEEMGSCRSHALCGHRGAHPRSLCRPT